MNIFSRRRMAIGFVFFALSAGAQTKPQFEVATIKQSAPIDFAALRTNPGALVPAGIRIEKGRAAFTRQNLAALIVFAYGFKAYQITGASLPEEDYDITAKLPNGAAKEDVPKMLQALLEDRFRLAVHRATEERPVMALTVAKGGLKMTPSDGANPAIDPDSPLKAGEGQTETEDGLMRTLVSMEGGNMTIGFDLGARGKVLNRSDKDGSSALQITKMTMGGLADVFAQLVLPVLLARGEKRQVVDMTGLKGNFDGVMVRRAVDLTDLAGLADSLRSSVEAGIGSLGLKLESGKAAVNVLIVDHVEKTPAAN